MTLRELSELKHLELIIQTEEERLARLEESLGLKSPALTGMPSAPGARDKIGETVPKIIEQKEQIEQAVLFYTQQREKILRYINSVTDVRIRLILIHRFINDMTWNEVADAMGGKETEDTVKKACYRYVEGRDDCEN